MRSFSLLDEETNGFFLFVLEGAGDSLTYSLGVSFSFVLPYSPLNASESADLVISFLSLSGLDDAPNFLKYVSESADLSLSL